MIGIAGAACLSLLGCAEPVDEQVVDNGFVPQVAEPAFEEGMGPRIAIDGGHFNFHTAEGRYAPFAALLRRDGFRVDPIATKFSEEALKDVDVLVIANAVNELNSREWSLPTPSAFERAEIEAVRDWVAAGGALLLIADHMPFGGAAAELAAEFGFTFSNGYAIHPGERQGEFEFTRADRTLENHAIVRGNATSPAVTRVKTFAGQGFRITGRARPLLKLPNNALLLMTERAGEFSNALRVPGTGFLQGATVELGKGRVAAFGEAALFSAQLLGAEKTPFGMNSPGAEENAQFALNVVHWLAERSMKPKAP